MNAFVLREEVLLTYSLIRDYAIWIQNAIFVIKTKQRLSKTLIRFLERSVILENFWDGPSLMKLWNWTWDVGWMLALLSVSVLRTGPASCCCTLWETAGGSSCTWVPATQVRDPHCPLGSWAPSGWSRSLWAFGDESVDRRALLYVCLFLFAFLIKLSKFKICSTIPYWSTLAISVS